ncbi:MAG: hypothetical protein AUK35_06410 [Zetaproteobacteria bacterium CG2_30_46_52]|nr:MAG: hypothetical protein AUK35_06410 [Zetaproteobacteria bacterium CG2_30_46_52]
MKSRCTTFLYHKAMLCLVLSGLLVACSSQPQLPKLSAHAVILAFGDSLTYGTGAPRGQAYPAVLAKLSGFTVVNAGVPGEVTSKGLARLPQVLEDEQPELLILCHGGNDLIRKTGEQQTAANLRAMVSLAQQQGIAVILVAVPRPTVVLSEPEFYVQIAEEFNITILSGVLPKILRKPSMKSDLIHPNNQGYQFLAKSLYELLMEANAI